MKPLEWMTRAKCETNHCAKVRRYYTRCRRFVVVESCSLFGLPTVWYAIQRFETNGVKGEKIISKHRKKHRAVQAVETYYRKANE